MSNFIPSEFSKFTHGDVMRYAHALTSAEASAEGYHKRLGRNLSKVYAKVAERRQEALKLAAKRSGSVMVGAVAMMALAASTVLSFESPEAGAVFGVMAGAVLAWVGIQLMRLNKLAAKDLTKGAPNHFGVALRFKSPDL